MYKQRLTNGFSDKFPSANPLSLHSLLKNYLESNSIPKSYKEIIKNNATNDNLDNSDEQ